MQKFVNEAEIQVVWVEDTESSREIAERKVAVLFVEKGNATDWLLRATA
jgi:hypothetical protein